jgi:hypothetical protein
MSEWHFGEIVSRHALMDEAISIAKEQKDMNSLALALSFKAALAYFERDPAEVDRFASELIELSTRHNFVLWLAHAERFETAIGLPNCTGCAVCFSRLLVVKRAKLRLRSAKPLESQRSRSPFRYRNAQRQPTRNIAAKKRAGQKVVDSDCLFGNFLAAVCFPFNGQGEPKSASQNSFAGG